MSLKPVHAERLLRDYFGPAINPVPRGERVGQDNDKVLGFETRSGTVLALDRKAAGTNIWFCPPTPPEIVGVAARKVPKNDNLNGRLRVLYPPHGMQVEIASEDALRQFLDWYSGR